MLQDVNTGIAWVLRNCGAFGGDGASFHLVGQSAGGQLASLALIAQVGGWAAACGGWMGGWNGGGGIAGY
jgi:acetyl esterase/lipase